MNTIAMAVHGGAGPDSDFIKQHQKQYGQGLTDALNCGYKILEGGGSSVDAVEAAVNVLEDNPLFNAGRGSALNEKAEVTMDASIMDGKNGKSGAACIIKNVKNPITLARTIMNNGGAIYLGETGALAFAKNNSIALMPDAYFITDHAFEELQKALKEKGNTMAEGGQPLKKRSHGTVGAVALDGNGNIAAGTSTGGIENKAVGRIGDSSIIGIGAYANNKTCAVSSTGDGEVLIQNVMAFHVSSIMQYKGLSLQEACRYLMHDELKDTKGDMGIIAVDAKGNIAMEFNSERMHRAFKSGEDFFVGIY